MLGLLLLSYLEKALMNYRIKMTRKEQIKIVNDKIKANNAQFKVDRLNAEISAFSEGNLNKYEFLTRQDFNLKPNVPEKAKFEFSPLGKVFSFGLDKNVEGYQEESIVKLLKDIRDDRDEPRGPPGPDDRDEPRGHPLQDDDRDEPRGPPGPDDGGDDIVNMLPPETKKK